MVNYKELIKSFTKSDYENSKVNLHIHTKYSDGKAEADEIIKQAETKDYKYISITDHNTIQGHIDFHHEKLIPGVEFDVWYKYIFLHLLAYGIDPKNPDLKRFMAKSKKETEADIIRIFAQRNLKELIKAIHNAGGIAVLAHPCCCWAINLEQFVKELTELGLDGIEVYYPYPRWRKFIKFSHPDMIETLADKFNLIKTGGTDCHEEKL